MRNRISTKGRESHLSSLLIAASMALVITALVGSLAWPGWAQTHTGGGGAGGASGANTALSNLTSPTAINQALTFAGGASVSDNGTGGLNLNAAGTNQNVTITPIGTGSVSIPSLGTATSGNPQYNSFPLLFTSSLYNGGLPHTMTYSIYDSPSNNSYNDLVFAPTNSVTAGRNSYKFYSGPGATGNLFQIFANTAGHFLMINNTLTSTYLDPLSGGGLAVVGGPLSSSSYITATNCASSTSPSVCGSAAAGRFVIAASSTSVVVDTTAVTANSEIQVTEDQSLGTALGVTCDTGTSNRPFVTARSAGVSFTVSIAAATATNPACFSYSIVN